LQTIEPGEGENAIFVRTRQLK